MKVANLAGIEAKLKRARDTLNALATELTAYMGQNYRVEGKLVGRRYAFYAYGPPDLPLSFSVIVGEIVHHLRSSLDHLVTELVAIGPGGGKANRLEFPICSSPEIFKKACKDGKIKGVSGVAQQTIEQCQPYHMAPSSHSILTILNNLNVVDKHRTLVLAAVAPEMTSTLSIDSNGQDVAIVGLSPPISAKMRPSPSGTEIFAVEFAEAYANPPSAHGVFPFRALIPGAAIQIPLDLPLLELLQLALKNVAGVIGTFFMATPDGKTVGRDSIPNITTTLTVVQQ